MTKPKFLLRAVAQSLDFVVVHDKIAVWTEQVIRHQICVVRRSEYLTIKVKQEFAYLI